MSCTWVVILTAVAVVTVLCWLVYRVTKRYNEGEYRGPGPL